jgi:hypothetical protein
VQEREANIRQKYLGPLQDRPIVGVKNCNMCFFIITCGTMCIICSKFEFITNIIYVTEISTFYFYNNKHIFIITDTKVTTKYTFYQDQHRSRKSVTHLDQYWFW